MKRLSKQSLATVKAQLPDYDRTHVKTGIVHLGVGAFHRAHQAVYIDDLLAHDSSWGIIGASLQSTRTAEALNPQDGLYTLIVKGGTEPECRVIGSISKVICAAENSEALLTHMTNPDVRIVSLTVTEKGYCHIPATGQLNLEHADIKHDATNPTQPRTAPGFLVAALRQRRLAGTQAFTILSCDNLPQNGRVAQQVVVGLARMQNPELAEWIEKQVAFPATMVDRIVPATTNREEILASNMTGVTDAWPVVTEAFCQWVVEDNFCTGRPAFERAGVIVTDNVHAFEQMKLRLLNGSHSALAYIGLLRGHSTVSQAMGDPTISSFVKKMMEDEVTDTLHIPTGVDISAYCDALLARFENPDLNHSLLQIASDGSQKLPQRILEPIRQRIANDQPITLLVQVIAAWMNVVSARQGQSYLFNVPDPLEAELRECITESNLFGTPPYTALLQRHDIFGADLPAHKGFRDAIEHAITQVTKLSL